MRILGLMEEKIGRYKLIRPIAKGGMGEVFLAYDPICERELALKRIREDLSHHPVMRERFLREAKIASQLTHPSIVPILSIHEEDKNLFYTMPYVEGKSLKDILKETRLGKDNPIGSSIPALMQIFLSVCQAVSYTHSKGFLHRDLKPDNILIGKFGEVLIIDWGLAERIGNPTPDGPAIESDPNLTSPGKVVGTVSFMAPERARSNPATVSTDIYALGSMLYLLLSLEFPFKRSSLDAFRQNMDLEIYTEPQEIAPSREIPSSLAAIAKKSLEKVPEDRYSSVSAIIEDLKNYTEGRPDWIPAANLSMQLPSDWEFQENIFLTKQLAEIAPWALLMVSKESFTGNTKLKIELKLGAHSKGLGILIGQPPPEERSQIEEGYCLFLSPSKNRLYRSGVEIDSHSKYFLQVETPHTIIVEKVDHQIRCHLDDQLLFSYLSHIPSPGTQIGLLLPDTDLEISSLDVLLGSQELMVNCLSVPDAFLASKDFSKALLEYRRIARSFAGRKESRDAFFRAGVTLINQAKSSNRLKKNELLLNALHQFEELHATPGAPLEYLGKSLVYKETEEIEEEVKCLELASRKFPKDPLKPIIEEQISFRLHETHLQNRLFFAHFLLLALRHLPELFENLETQSLLDNFARQLEPLPFLEIPSTFSSTREEQLYLAIQIAIHLEAPRILLDLYQDESPFSETILLALFHLGALTSADIQNLPPLLTLSTDPATIDQSLETFFSKAHVPLTSFEEKVLFCLFDKGLTINSAPKLLPFLPQLPPENPHLQTLHLWTLLLTQKFTSAQKLLSKNPTPLMQTLYSCASDAPPPLTESAHPPLHALLPHYLHQKIHLTTGWAESAFPYEKRQLFRHLSLYHLCQGKKRKALSLEKKFLINE